MDECPETDKIKLGVLPSGISQFVRAAIMLYKIIFVVENVDRKNIISYDIQEWDNKIPGK